MKSTIGWYRKRLKTTTRFRGHTKILAILDDCWTEPTARKKTPKKKLQVIE